MRLVQLIRDIGNSVSWQMSRMGVVRRRVPSFFRGAVLSQIGERYSQLIAFFLPLKVIILLGSDSVPRYFQFFIVDETRDAWIWGLSAGVPAFYALSLMFGFVVRRRVQSASELLTSDRNPENSRKSYRFIRQYRRIFSAFSSNVSNGCVIILALLLLIVVDIHLIIVIAVYFAMVIYVIVLIQSFDETRIFSKIARFIQSRKKMASDIICEIGFFLAFGYLVMSFLFLEGMNIIFAIIMLLLSRQIFRSLRGIVGSSLWFEDNRILVDQYISAIEHPEAMSVDDVVSISPQLELDLPDVGTGDLDEPDESEDEETTYEADKDFGPGETKQAASRK